MSECPEISAWEQMSRGETDDATAQRLRLHLQACPHCRDIFEGVARNNRLLDSIKSAWRESAGASPVGSAPVGLKIGRYEVTGFLGAGGMATVYRAVQEQPHRTVALKVMKLGFASRTATRRFEHEAEVLGRLHHPGIAHIYEAGFSEIAGQTQPFFAMELIDGEKLTDRAAARNYGNRERLELMARIGEAVHYAHQKGVIHRDLKPSNILVTDELGLGGDHHGKSRGAIGQPKVLDFGVARATDVDIQASTLRTDIGQLVGTIPYMSPEQAAGDPNELDVRSDVYSLGVVCYELLSGQLPYSVRGRSIPEAVRVIQQDDPTPLSSVNRVFRGDLETIVAKALEKDKDRRYAAVSAFVADIRRYLNDEPIAARRPSATYQLAKFARRNRALVGGAAAVFAALVFGLTGTGYGLFRATAERNHAVEAEHAARIGREQAESVISLLKQMLGSADPEQTKGANYTVRQLLDDFDEGLKGRSIGQPEVEATIRATIGNAYLGLGLREQAERELKAALDLRVRIHGPEHIEVARSLCDYAWFHRNNADYPRAEQLYLQALELQRRILGPRDVQIATTLNRLSDVLRYQERYDEAESMARDALSMRREILGPMHVDVASDLNNLGWVLVWRGKHKEAESTLREALGIWRGAYGERHPFIANGLHGLALALDGENDASAAEATFREALLVGRSALGERHHDVGSILNDYGWSLSKVGRYAESEPLIREGLEIVRSVHGEGHPCVADHLKSLAMMYAWSGDPGRAEPLFREALAIFREKWGETHGRTEFIRSNLADVLIVLGKADEALELAQDVLARYRTSYGEKHRATANIKRVAGLAMVRQGHAANAEPLLRESVATYAELSNVEPWRVARAESTLGQCLVALQRFEEADPLLHRSYETLASHAESPACETRAAMERTAALYEAWNKPEQAEEWKSRLATATEK